MSDFYQFCSICDGELNDTDKKLNVDKGSIYYPICGECLSKSEKKLKDIVEKHLD